MEKMKCKKCNQICVKNGKTKSGEQRYYCVLCEKSQQINYTYQACKPKINNKLIALLKEGCGIRSISRLLKISPTTTIRRILTISNQIKSPSIVMGKMYEVDELCTYIGNKNRKRWVAYSLRKDTKEVVNFAVGTRTKRTLQQIINSLLLAEAKTIFTDKLNIYKSLIPSAIHCSRQYRINHIERKNLTLRTHLKRLNRRTICFSKSILMLTACLKIYFWG
ncbi:MAG: IS1 family transposase [Flavobacteriales bacterium]|nr:IS1 family transposase [Flavobacteriales bacterium]MCW8969376.1 IS1 family transposase [Flavobacteriales bacterium]MCW8990119.1 IS1 family transposase [Flavobacteriales bacterium]MCW9019837.1 IS1 family transposase [Flavobacteriales bacterium]